MRFEQAWNELKSSVPKIDALFAQKCVTRAWEEIQDSRLWSFLCGETVISVPNALSAGTVTAVQGNTTIVLDAEAALPLAGMTTNQIVERTIRVGTNLYNIIAYDGAFALTVEYGYNGPTASGLSYMIYQPYVLAPADFLSWRSVIDPYSPMPIFDLTTTKEELDALDPQRGCLGQPYRLSTYRYESNLAGSAPPVLDRWRYELWPHPITFRQYPALYQKQGLAWTTGTRQPSIIGDSLIMARAKYIAYEWAEANKGRHPELKGTNWLNLRTAAQKEYEADLAQTCRQDEEMFIQNFPRSYISVAGQALGDQYYLDHAPKFGGYGWW